MNSIHEPSKEYTLDENSQFTIGRVAQWIRRPTSNRKIVGSIPIVVNFAKKRNSKNQKCRGTQDNSTLRVGFEPTREDPI